MCDTTDLTAFGSVPVSELPLRSSTAIFLQKLGLVNIASGMVPVNLLRPSCMVSGLSPVYSASPAGIYDIVDIHRRS